MAKSKKSTEFRESDREKYWYVGELDPNRPMRRTCSRDRWIPIVNALIERDAEGHLIHREPWLESDDGLLIIRVGTPEWQTFLRKFIYSTGYRMCWEPKPPREHRRPAPSLFADEDAAQPVRRRRRSAA